MTRMFSNFEAVTVAPEGAFMEIGMNDRSKKREELRSRLERRIAGVLHVKPDEGLSGEKWVNYAAAVSAELATDFYFEMRDKADVSLEEPIDEPAECGPESARTMLREDSREVPQEIAEAAEATNSATIDPGELRDFLISRAIRQKIKADYSSQKEFARAIGKTEAFVSRVLKNPSKQKLPVLEMILGKLGLRLEGILSACHT